MKIEISEGYGFVLKDVFNGVMFETEEGEKLGVCMRDGGFEISVIPPGAPEDAAPDCYSIRNGEVKNLGFRVAEINLNDN